MENGNGLTQSQTIKQILEICEMFGVPDTAITTIRKKCWYLADTKGNGEGNGTNNPE